MITEAVRVATIVQTDLVLAVLPIVTRIANTPRHGKLHGTMAPMRTVMVAVPYATIVIDEGRRALARPEAVTNAIRLAKTSILPVRREGTWYARHVDLILVMVRMVITGLAAVLADLFVRVLVHVTKISRTRNVGTVRPVITAVALAETVTTITLVVAVVRAVVHTQPPHVIQNY